MDTSWKDFELLTLIKDAREGTLVLPQFQRNFVWSRDAITDLLVSILEGHFIGTFLLLRTAPHDGLFAARALEGIDLDRDELKPNFMILDGQQRLTSLHYAFAAPPIPIRYAKNPYRFFLNLDTVVYGDLESAITSERADYAQKWGWLESEWQFENLTIPFTEIEHWDDWLKKYEDWVLAKGGYEAFDHYRKRYREHWPKVINRLRTFRVPSIIIENASSDDPKTVAQVCAIFEKMNTKGVRLSVYDLLTARHYRYGIDMHELWEKTISDYPLLNQYSEGKPDIFGVFVLRAIALLRKLDVKSKTLINLSHVNFEADWERAVAYMEKALERITSTNPEGFGVFAPKWMPYSTMVSPMAALLAYFEKNRFDHRAYQLLRRWYWASVFTERYAGAVESLTYRDYQDIIAVLEGKDIVPQAIADAEGSIVNNQRFSLLEEARLNSVYRGVMCLVALRGAKDFFTGDSIEFHDLDDHHIFPKAYLKRQRQPDGSPIPDRHINSIVNRTLIASDTNRRIISRTPPAEYVKNRVPEAIATQIMASHHITPDALDAMRRNDFEAFLLYREKALVDEIRRQLMG